MPTEFDLAIEQICEEKGIPKEKVIESIEFALAAAFRKDYGKKGQHVEVKFDPATKQARVFEVKEVIKEVTDPKKEISLKEAKKIEKGIKIGGFIKTDITPKDAKYGRIAAQTAKQVIIQRLREAEKEVIFSTFKNKKGQVLTGIVQRVEKNIVFVDLGQAIGILYPQEQIERERYNIGDRLKVYVLEIKDTPREPEIVLSRSHPKIIEELLKVEVPEIVSGTVKIKAIAREAGFRSKVAVYSTEEGIDPIGACIGQRGARIQTIISEIKGEKIDIIQWDENPVRFISNALSPAKVISVKLNEEKKHAIVEVIEDQLSLAIGKEGQNVRLAVKLTGWKIDVVVENKEERKIRKKTKRNEKKLEKQEIKKEGTKKKPEKKEEKKKKVNEEKK